MFAQAIEIVRLFVLPPKGPLRRLQTSLLAIAVIVVVGTVGYMRLADAAFLDALFMTVITISTVGYGLTVPTDTAPEKIFTIALILSSLVLIAWAVHGVVGLAFADFFWSYVGKQRMQSRIDRLSGHTIVCGYGRMGHGVVLELGGEGVPLVIVEQDDALTSELAAEDHLVVTGDATRDSVLLRAGVDRAGALIGVTASDANNVLIALSARALNPSLTIATRADHKESVQKLHRAGVDYVLHHHGTGAMHLALFVTHPAVEGVLRQLLPRSGDLDFGQVAVAEGTTLVGKTLVDVGAYRSGAIILAVSRGDELFVPPDPQLPLEAGDLLVVVGSPGALHMVNEIAAGV